MDVCSTVNHFLENEQVFCKLLFVWFSMVLMQIISPMVNKQNYYVQHFVIKRDVQENRLI